jgi:hypothetical protein
MNQQVLAAPIAELPVRLASDPLGGPVTVMIGRVFAAHAAAGAARTSALPEIVATDAQR